MKDELTKAAIGIVNALDENMDDKERLEDSSIRIGTNNVCQYDNLKLSMTGRTKIESGKSWNQYVCQTREHYYWLPR